MKDSVYPEVTITIIPLRGHTWGVAGKWEIDGVWRGANRKYTTKFTAENILEAQLSLITHIHGLVIEQLGTVQ